MPIDDNFTIQKLTGAKSLICVIGLQNLSILKDVKKELESTSSVKKNLNSFVCRFKMA